MKTKITVWSVVSFLATEAFSPIAPYSASGSATRIQGKTGMKQSRTRTAQIPSTASRRLFSGRSACRRCPPAAICFMSTPPWFN